MNQLIDKTVEAFGSIDDVAQALHTTYVTSKPGSAGQVRVLDLIGRMLLRRDGDETHYESMDGYTRKQLDAELARELGVPIEEITGSATGSGETSPEPTG